MYGEYDIWYIVYCIVETNIQYNTICLSSHSLVLFVFIDKTLQFQKERVQGRARWCSASMAQHLA
jgi:hypothetical protein